MALLAPRTTTRLLLREIVPGDAVAIHDYEGRPEVARFLSHPPFDLDGARALVAGAIAEGRSEPRTVWQLAVVGGAAAGGLAGRLVGRLKVRMTGFQPREATFGYAFHPDAAGRGFATEATAALLDLAFGELGLRRAVAEVDPRNGPSIRLCERLGLRREGHLVANAWLQGEWRDTLVFAALAREWPALRETLSRRARPSAAPTPGPPSPRPETPP